MLYFGCSFRDTFAMIKTGRAFLSHPVSDYLGSDGRFRADRKSILEKLVQSLEGAGFEVVSAGVNERYGEVKLQPVEFTKYDIDAIESAALFVLFASERLTQDMYLEIGIALARRIPILFVIPASARVTYMVYGLVELGHAELLRYDSEASAPQLLGARLSRGFSPRDSPHGEMTEWAASR